MRQAQNVIQEMLTKGGFKAAVLTNESGLPLVALPYGSGSEAPAAMVAFIRRVFDRVHRRVGLRGMDEVMLRDEVGQILVCKRIVASGQDLVLAVLVPPGREYRQAVDWAVWEIQQVWEERHENGTPG